MDLRKRLIAFGFAVLLAGLACEIPYLDDLNLDDLGLDDLGLGGGRVEPTRNLSNYTPAAVTPATLPPKWTPTTSNIPTPIPGWERFSTRDFEIWLPERYDGGSPGQEIEVIAEQLSQMGPSFQEVAEALREDPNLIALWMFDTEAETSGFVTNVNLTEEQVSETITVIDYMAAAQDILPEEYQVVGQEVVSLAAYPQAGRLFIDTVVAGTQIKEVLYVIKEGTQMYLITYATIADEFEGRLPTFELSAETFRLRP